MASIHWTYAFLVFLGTMGDAQAQTCTQEYLLTVSQCLSSFAEVTASISNVSTSSGFNTTITSQLLIVKVFCERPENLQALICVINAMKVCGDALGIPAETRLILSKYDESLINKMCGYLPALEQNLSCLNGLVNSITLATCVAPAYYISQSTTGNSCRIVLAHAVCALTEVETMCPAVGEVYRYALQLYTDPSCSIDLCTLDYGDCGGKFRRNMPLEAVQKQAGDLVAYSYGIQYICGSGKPNVECMMKGNLCEGFSSMMNIPLLFGIQLEPARYLVNYGCKDINTLTLKLQCLNQQFASEAFQTCFSQMLSTMTSLPSTPYDVVSCGIYQGTLNCMNSVIAKQCGQEVVDYYIKWSPAVFRLAEGCGSWKVSSASSVEKITTLMLLQFSIAMIFLLKN